MPCARAGKDYVLFQLRWMKLRKTTKLAVILKLVSDVLSNIIVGEVGKNFKEGGLVQNIGRNQSAILLKIQPTQR